MAALHGSSSSPSRVNQQQEQQHSGPRRTSSSFKHVKHNSLVSNSPFKSPPPPSAPQQPLVGSRSTPPPLVSASAGRRPVSLYTTAASSSSLSLLAKSGGSSGGSPSSSTIPTVVGLGISATTTTPSRKSSSSTAIRPAATTTTTTSTSSSLPSPLSHRRGSADNVTLGPSTANRQQQQQQGGGVRFPTTTTNDDAHVADSPDVKARHARKPRQSVGLAKLDRGALVSRSPFLAAAAAAAPAPAQHQHHQVTSGTTTTSPVAAARAKFEGSPSLASPAAKMPTPTRPANPSTHDVFSPSASARVPSSSSSRGSPTAYRRVSPSLGGTRERSSPRQRHVSPLHHPTASLGVTPVRRSMSGSLRTERTSPSPSPSSSSHGLAASSRGTPTKSSITSRRLKGPRLEASSSSSVHAAAGSPSKKTVTFRSVPEVKEFEIEDHGEGETSVEVDEDEEAYETEEEEEEEEEGAEAPMEQVDLASFSNRASILCELDPSQYPGASSSSTGPSSSVPNPPSYGYHRGMEDDDDDDDASMDGDDSYMDTLVEDGYFSPPEPRSVSEMPGPRPDLTGQEEAPSSSHHISLAAAGATLSAPAASASAEASTQQMMLATPNLGSPLDLGAAVDEVGIPYGRSHHAERAHAAHAIEAHSRPTVDIPQPNLPHQGYEPGAPVIRSQDVTQPSLRDDSARLSGSTVQSHQDGTFEDPFMTLQTATSVLSPAQERQESGVPLGRTSHVERAKAARLLATQSLGLGMPRRPAFAEPYEGESEDGSADEASDGEDGIALGEQPEEVQAEEPRRALPQPPQIPQRNQQEAVEKLSDETDEVSEASDEKPASLSYALPALGNSTSPLLDLGSFRTSSPLKSASTTSEDSRPLTPPQRRAEPKEDSPHHIPEFNFGDELSLEPDMTTSEAFRMVEDLLPKPKTAPTAVRQRISKDMIRQRMEAKRSLDAESPPPPPPPPKERSRSPAASPARARPDLSSLRTRSAQEVLEGGLAPVSPLEKLVQGNDDALATELERVQLSTSQSQINTAQPQTPTRRIVSLTGQHGAGVPDVFLQSPISSPALKKGRGSIRRVSHGHTRTLSDSSVIPEPTSPSRLAIKGLSSSNSSILSSLEDELEKIAAERNYRIRESKQKIVASSHGAGDVDAGRAWRQLRKPSDMNEYAAELREIRARKDQKEKAFGTIFVKVLGIESLSLPLPSERTAFCITLDNGIDYIRTPYSQLQEGARINQEFALVEHANFEFTLGLEVRRDPHIVRLQQANAHSGQALLSDAASTASSKPSGFRGLFHSPRKDKARPMAAVPRDEENICRFFSSNDSTIGRSHIAFKPIAKNCDSRLLEIRYPMFGIHQKDGKRQICKITLQMFRLPPLSGLTAEQLPQSIDECLRGMRHHAWHQHEYHEGTLTQRGGDCKAPRRRHFKIIGGSLVASNEVTKKHVISIDLRKAVAVHDDNKPRERGDEPYNAMPRSFSITFKDAESITFRCDIDNEKASWMKALDAIVGKVPSNPLWAEVLAAKMRAARARSASGLPPTSPAKPSVKA